MPGCGAAQRRHVARRNSETTSLAHIGGRIGSYRRDGRVAEPDRHPPEPILTRSPTSAPLHQPSSNVILRTSLVPSSPRLCQVGGAKPVSGRSDPPYRYINKRTLNVGGGKNTSLGRSGTHGRRNERGDGDSGASRCALFVIVSSFSAPRHHDPASQHHQSLLFSKSISIR